MRRNRGTLRKTENLRTGHDRARYPTIQQQRGQIPRNFTLNGRTEGYGTLVPYERPIARAHKNELEKRFRCSVRSVDETMTTNTNTICCYCGSRAVVRDGTDYRCNTCGQQLIVSANGTTRLRFDWMTAGRQNHRRGPKLTRRKSCSREWGERISGPRS